MPEEECDGIAMLNRLKLTKEIKNTSKRVYCVQLSCECVNETQSSKILRLSSQQV